MYASVADLRAEGVTPAAASDARLEALLNEASAFIDQVTGWFFEPRALTLRLDGRGAPTIEPPVPILRLDALLLDDASLSLAPDDLVVVGAPVAPGFDAPRFTLRRGRVFPSGAGNVTAVGVWGYTEPDGTPFGRTPLAIRRVAMQLALRALPKLADADGSTTSAWRVVEERTRDQSYRLAAPLGLGVVFTGDPEIDQILARYRRPPGLGAA